jgi:hypothetical protein
MFYGGAGSVKAIQIITGHQIDRIDKTLLSAPKNVNAEHKSDVLTVLNCFKVIRK